MLALLFLLGRMLLLAHNGILFMTNMGMILIVGVLDGIQIRRVLDYVVYGNGLAGDNLIA